MTSTTTAHEVKQLIILRLKFRTGSQVFDLKALDFPSDTENIYIDTVPYVTLVDQVYNVLKNIDLPDIFSKILPILIVVATIIILIIAFPTLTAVFKGIGTGIKYRNSMKKSKRDRKLKKNNKVKRE
ncbi:MAG: hypothetical protein LBV51_04140 [Acholeplasmatales bacterium]|jgi:hypothetical protein|nr:hypothetical protein [Acholeplasmatales bacterium]